MNTFLPYLDTFTHTNGMYDSIHEAVFSKGDRSTRQAAAMPSPDDAEDNAYSYEIEMVLDEDDDFYIG